MANFEIDPAEIAEIRERAAQRGAAGEGPELVSLLRAGERLDAESLAALFLAEDVSSDDLLALACELRVDDRKQLETFSPLYISNECDAECVMCGMRRVNEKLQRETADGRTVREQLDILHQRGLRGVALLTGEYRHGELRREMLARTAASLRAAVERGFEHVLINVGSLEHEEYPGLLADIERASDGAVGPQLTMCTFQETYDPAVYARFMGSNPDNPRGDFKRRLENFDRAADAGMRFANPGLLLGLNRDVAYELLALIAHVKHLVTRGMTVYVSLPRLRKASGAEHRAGVSDADLTRLVSLLSAGLPEARVVISTREAPEIQQRLLPVIAVLTAGSPGVAPYTAAGARFEVEASQFEVLDQRPMETILDECLATGSIIAGYVPAASRSASRSAATAL
jgi:2-iminoacetate synthase